MENPKTSRKAESELTGMQFGKLVVVSKLGERRNGHIMWECRCDCGNIKVVPTSDLTRGKIKSCGCAPKGKWDLRGKRFGSLTVLDMEPEFYVAPSGGRYRQWNCRCDCGNVTLVRASNLINGRSSSCGCWQGGRSKYVKID